VKVSYVSMFAAVLMSATGGFCCPATAGTVTLVNNYWGGENTYDPSNGASIGGSPFIVTAAQISRRGPGGDTLQVVIDTPYAGAAGLDGTGYGSLFITPGANAWQPTGTAPNYGSDTYQSDEWKYALTMPTDPKSNFGKGGLYLTGGGALVGPNSVGIVASNVYGSTITYPNPGNPGWYFRQGQAVQFNPAQGATSYGAESWSVNSKAGTITFDVVDDGLLGDNFAMAWGPTCANAVIQGQVSGVTAVPEPSTWAMLVVGFCGLGFVGVRRARAQGREAIAV
jgi:hypothetical protein